jgi:hypothetical protein
MSYYYDPSGYLLTLSISGLTAVNIPSLSLTISDTLTQKYLTNSGYISASISSYVYDVSTISGYFSGLTNFTISGLVDYTTSDIIYTDFFTYLTSSSYISPWITLPTLSLPSLNKWISTTNIYGDLILNNNIIYNYGISGDLQSISGSIGNLYCSDVYYNSGVSLSGIIYTMQNSISLKAPKSSPLFTNASFVGMTLIDGLSLIVNASTLMDSVSVNSLTVTTLTLGITDVNTRFIYDEKLILSISSYVKEYYYNYGNQLNTLNNKENIDQYARNEIISLSGFVHEIYYNYGSSINTINSKENIDQYARNYEISLSSSIFYNNQYQNSKIISNTSTTDTILKGITTIQNTLTLSGLCIFPNIADLESTVVSLQNTMQNLRFTNAYTDTGTYYNPLNNEFLSTTLATNQFIQVTNPPSWNISYTGVADIYIGNGTYTQLYRNSYLPSTQYVALNCYGTAGNDSITMTQDITISTVGTYLVSFYAAPRYMLNFDISQGFCCYFGNNLILNRSYLSKNAPFKLFNSNIFSILNVGTYQLKIYTSKISTIDSLINFTKFTVSLVTQGDLQSITTPQLIMPSLILNGSDLATQITNATNTDQYARNYETSISGFVSEVFFNYGSLINTINNKEVIDIYDRNKLNSLSGFVREVFFNYGSSINTINNKEVIDVYDRNKTISLSGFVKEIFFNYGYSLSLLAPIASPTFTGTVTMPACIFNGSGLLTQLNAKADIASPTFTGMVTAPIVQITNFCTIPELTTTTSLRISDTPIYLRGGSDNNHYIIHNSTRDGPKIVGYAGGALHTQSSEIAYWTDNGLTVATGNINYSNYTTYTSGDNTINGTNPRVFLNGSGITIRLSNSGNIVGQTIMVIRCSNYTYTLYFTDQRGSSVNYNSVTNSYMFTWCPTSGWCSCAMT